MEYNKSTFSQFKNNANYKLLVNNISTISNQMNFRQSANAKLGLPEMLFSFFQMLTKGNNTYTNWCEEIFACSKISVTKQALHKIMNEDWACFVERLFQEVVVQIIEKTIKIEGFNNVWIQDSTCIGLPDFFLHLFPGNKSLGKPKAVAKLNFIVNALSNTCKSINLVPYNYAESYLANEAIKICSPGDLIIRDLGYLSINNLRAINAQKASFVSKLKYGYSIFGLNGKTLTISELMKNKNLLDRDILLGKEKLPVRLIIKRLPPTEIEKRCRKASRNQDRRVNYTSDYYEQLKYSILITNIPKHLKNATEIHELYKIRWQIEILFKGLKSHLNLEKIIPQDKKNEYRTVSYIYLTLIYLLLTQRNIEKHIDDGFVYLSQLRIYALCTTNIDWVFKKLDDRDVDYILKHCKYEERQREPAHDAHIQLFNKNG